MMAVQRQFMDQQCEIITKISCEVAFLSGMVEQLQKENAELKNMINELTTKDAKGDGSVMASNSFERRSEGHA
jgi:hypothetical protein